MNCPLENRRLFSIIAHVDHGKTTTTDYLLRRAGLISFDLAGQVLLTDFDLEEQERGITIFTTVALLSYEFNDNTYLLEINDTPGHISFTGEVSRALRGSDGAIILVDALEGVMTQTETNLRIAVGEELCKPLLFINKVDRLISELRLGPKELSNRVDSIIEKVNDLIEKNVLKDFQKDWRVSFPKNTVAIGSAKDGWGFTSEILKEKEFDPNLLFEKYYSEDVEWLRKNLPLDEALLRMILKSLPDPKVAQKYRIPKIWSGNIESQEGKSLVNTDPEGPLIGLVTKVFIDPKTNRPISIGRIFSGTLKGSDSIFLINQNLEIRVKRLGVMEFDRILDCPKIPAGNFFAIFGEIFPIGDTFVEPGSGKITPFENIHYVSEPVVSITIEPKKTMDLDRLQGLLNIWTIADPSAKYSLDEETGEFILSGIDPLQLEILTKRINEQAPILISPPIVMYREKPTKEGLEFYCKSFNEKNRIRLLVEPLNKETIALLRGGKVSRDQKARQRAKILSKKAGWPKHEAENIWDIFNLNILVCTLPDIKNGERIKNMIISSFRDWVKAGTLAKESVWGLKAKIRDLSVGKDPASSNVIEIGSMIHSALHLSFLSAEPKIIEPVLKIDVKTPIGMEGEIIKILNKHRGQIIRLESEEDSQKITGTIPSSETVEIADEFRSSTQGRAFWGYEFLGYEPLDDNLQGKIILELRERKGMIVRHPTPDLWENFIIKS